MFRTTFDAEKKQWNGVKTESPPKQTSLGIEIFNKFKEYGPRVAQICANTGKTQTFDDLRVLTNRIARNLQNFGCKKGQRIFLFTKRDSDIAPMAFAALYLGCQISSILLASTEVECEYFLSLINPDYIIADVEFYPMLKKCSENLKMNTKFVIFGDLSDESVISADILFAHQNDDDTNIEPIELNSVTETAFILRTSGTTGLFKAVPLSHATILDNMKKHKRIFETNHKVLAFGCLGGVTFLRCVLAPIFHGSARIVNPGSASPERYFELVERHKVTVSVLGSYFATQISNHPEIKVKDLSSLKFVYSSGTKLPYETIQKLNKCLPNAKVYHHYGVTETCGSIAYNLIHSRNNSVGQLMSDCEAKIVDDNGQRLGINEEGELCLKLPFPFLGYLNSNESCLDSDGFIITGDIARFDENGDLFIGDRKREIFKSESGLVSPQEIEEFLDKIEGVKQSCVVPILDGMCDYLPAAVIVKTDQSTCSEQTIYESVSNRFAHFKRLRGGVYFVDALPMTPTGKIARILVKNMAIQLYKNSQNIIV